MDVLYALESSSVYTVNYKAEETILLGALKITKKDKKSHAHLSDEMRFSKKS
jgi:hypothetical protein